MVNFYRRPKKNLKRKERYDKFGKYNKKHIRQLEIKIENTLENKKKKAGKNKSKRK